MERLVLDTPESILAAATTDIEGMYLLHGGITPDVLLCFRVWDHMYVAACRRAVP